MRVTTVIDDAQRWVNNRGRNKGRFAVTVYGTDAVLVSRVRIPGSKTHDYYQFNDTQSETVKCTEAAIRGHRSRQGCALRGPL